MRKEIKVLALVENLNNLLEFLEDCLTDVGADVKRKTLLYVACEEIFVNIAHYAYSGVGSVDIIFEYLEDEKQVRVTFIDSGVPFNPVERANPDVTLPAEERNIGGLGIYMVKKTMDDLIYCYKENKNCLTLVKNLT